MELPLRDILLSYNDQSPLAESYTIPAAWYVDERIAELERAASRRTGVAARVP
jgi:hypothetical protein